MKLPAPYVVIEDFLAPDVLTELLAYTLENERRFEPRRVTGGVLDPDRWKALKLNDLGPFGPMLHGRIDQEYAGWVKRLRLSAFALGQVELRMAAYLDGGSFAYHLDTASSAAAAEHSRLLTGVYYYHREPQGFTGGAIRLFDLGAAPESDLYREVPPKQNSLLLFPSWVGHQVMPIQCASGSFVDSRFSINVWLHREAGRT